MRSVADMDRGRPERLSCALDFAAEKYSSIAAAAARQCGLDIPDFRGGYGAKREFCTASSATQCRSNPVSGLVSRKREYFKYPPETIGYSGSEMAKFGVWRPAAHSQKPAIGGHFLDC